MVQCNMIYPTTDYLTTRINRQFQSPSFIIFVVFLHGLSDIIFSVPCDVGYSVFHCNKKKAYGACNKKKLTEQLNLMKV